MSVKRPSCNPGGQVCVSSQYWDVHGWENREFWMGRQLRDTDLLPDYGRIAARFDQIAEFARMRGDESIAERLHHHAGQIREDLRHVRPEFHARH